MKYGFFGLIVAFESTSNEKLARTPHLALGHWPGAKFFQQGRVIYSRCLINRFAYAATQVFSTCSI